MCGIAGIVAKGVTESHRNALQRMTDAMTHRGPDGEGHDVFNNCALGHRRLAIVDIATGAQPMRSADGKVAITFNGEIYGYKDLRHYLKGYPFRTTSDTEVILALYQLRGADALEHLPGMFAFAIWDDAKQELLCARDRFGEKPLYYAIGQNGEFVFASEIKGILASGLVEGVVDREVVARYLQRLCVRTDQSIYRNIRALPPGHCLRYRNGRLDISRYWLPPQVQSDIDATEAVERFRELLRKAVQRQLVADVPIGAFLSGGLDSSTICSVASECVEDLRTFSFNFPGGHSEAAYARAAADLYGTRHTELATKHVNVADEILRMQRIYDEPFADSSNIPTYLLAGEARRHVKVVLTGDGGDELFGGYPWYKPLLWMKREGRLGILRWVAARAANRLCSVARLPGAVHRELRVTGLAYGRRYSSVLSAHRLQLSFFDRHDLEELGLAESLSDDNLEIVNGTGTIDDAIRLDVDDYMPADILTKIDRASMAHGLELRAPFLDIEFASFCLSLPYRLKVSTSDDKIILRKAFAERWPESVRIRSKQGFGAPLARWFQDSAVRALEYSLLQNPGASIYELISYSAARRILRRNNLMQRWIMLVLAVWLAEKNKVRVDRS